MKSLSFALILLLHIAFGSTEESHFTGNDGSLASSLHVRRYAPITPRRRGSLPESSDETARDQPQKMRLTEQNGFLLLRISPLLYIGYRPSVTETRSEYKRADVSLGSGLLSKRSVAFGDLESRNREVRKRGLDSELRQKLWHTEMLWKHNSGSSGTTGAESRGKRGYDDFKGEFSPLCKRFQQDCPDKFFAFVQGANPITTNAERLTSKY